MSSFRDQLNQSAVNKTTLQNVIQHEIDQMILLALAKRTQRQYDFLKKEILDKLSRGDFTIENNRKAISGTMRLLGSMTPEYMPMIKHHDSIRHLSPSEIQAQYLFKYPFARMHYDGDCGEYVLEFPMVRMEEHRPFLGKRYHSYYMTPIAKRTLNLLKRYAAADGIDVSFSHLILGFSDDGPNIPDGGNDQYLKASKTAYVVIKYSITF